MGELSMVRMGGGSKKIAAGYNSTNDNPVSLAPYGFKNVSAVIITPGNYSPAPTYRITQLSKDSFSWGASQSGDGFYWIAVGE